MHLNSNMGKTGRLLGDALGQALGYYAGSKLGKFTGIGADEGGKRGAEIAGTALEHLIPFKKGGRVRKTGPALVHKGEFILPKGVAPTTQQKRKVAVKHHKMMKHIMKHRRK
jgi:hypothetical protein